MTIARSPPHRCSDNNHSYTKKIKKGDKVRVIYGRDKGIRGRFQGYGEADRIVVKKCYISVDVRHIKNTHSDQNFKKGDEVRVIHGRDNGIRGRFQKYEKAAGVKVALVKIKKKANISVAEHCVELSVETH